MKKIAILGATNAQKPLYLKARKYGLNIIGISRKEDAICQEFCDRFYPISIADIDKVVECCKNEKVDGVVSNCSEFATRVVARVAEQLGLDCTPYSAIEKIQDKSYTRKISNIIPGLKSVRQYLYHDKDEELYPCVVKPVTSSAKIGVSFVLHQCDFDTAISYAKSTPCNEIIVEEYIEGVEVSVESISCRGKHYVVQITDKESSGPPHFVELSHHQPSAIDNKIISRIREIIPHLLGAVGFVTGATHTELKIDSQGNIYLIEINPRGGGDEISSRLVELSTGYDYIASMLFAALGNLKEPIINECNHAGIYFLTKQTEGRKDLFINASKYPWFVDGFIDNDALTECVTNRHKNGFLIYKSNHKITVKDIL